MVDHVLGDQQQKVSKVQHDLATQQATISTGQPPQELGKEFEERKRRDALSLMINQPNVKQMTSMHAACLSGNIQIVSLLQKNKADMLCKDHNGFLPIHYAVVTDSSQILKELRSKHDFNILDEQYNCQNYRLMSLAILNGSFECIKTLVFFGANCNVKEPQEYTYLHMAAISGHVNIFLYFLSKQVSLHAKTAQGQHAFEIAERYKNYHLINYLRDKFDANNVM